VVVAREVGSLEHLLKLDLSHNKIKDLPEEVFKIKRLTELKLEHNSMEVLSAGIGEFGSLRHLVK
jgi:Leucine-rich repeat (LRR) protein